MSGNSDYLLGHADPELERLQLQAACLEGVTRRLIRECGMAAGMRVLDFGCGVGDVSMLVADAVGPSGAVVGVDLEPRALETARARAAKAGFGQIEFIVGSDRDVAAHAPFDAAIGRYVLVHQPDPAAMIRRIAAAVRPGGTIAFLEAAFHVGAQMLPPVKLMQAAGESMKNFMRVGFPSCDIAGRIAPCFEDAGLLEPHVRWESIVPGSDPKYLRWFVATYQTLLPHMEKFGMVNPDVGDPATLFGRILAELRAVRAQVVTPPQVSAWAVRP